MQCFILCLEINRKLLLMIISFVDLAAGNGHLECLQWLVEMGANSKYMYITPFLSNN